MKGNDWIRVIAEEISKRSSNSDKAFNLRDATISKAVKRIAAHVTEQLELVVSEIQSNRFGKSTFDQTKRKSVRAKYRALDTVGAIAAEMIGSLDFELFASPEEPADDAMCIRYLTPEKWLWLQHQKSIRFSDPSTFASDPFDSTFPTVVLRECLNELSQYSVFDGMDPAWVQSAVFHWMNQEDQRRRRYLISCWNLFDEHTSHLMWSQFAGGRCGAAIVCRFGVLRDALEEPLTDGSFSNIEMDGAGFVSYDVNSMVGPPYFKRPEYKDEREIRFVAQAIEPDEFALPLHSLVGSMRAIVPPDSPAHHKKAVIASWETLCSSLSD